MQQKATILSAELSGMQALTESLPPEGITSLMGEIHTLTETTARMHHGNLNRFTGDTFMAVFHPGKTGKSAAIHAIDAACELNEQMQAFSHDKKLKQAFNLKIGIATGGILSTEIGSKENVQQTIMGEAVNHAQRICRFASDGQTLVDGSSHEWAKDHCVFQSLEPIPLKGGDETLAIFELIEKKRKKMDVSSMERKIASEMVGRGREAEQLESLIKKLIAGKGSVVNIVGKAGIGKSRLVAEMKVQPIMENVLLLEGRAMSSGKNLSFHPLIHLIKSWAGITEEDPSALASEKLQRGIQQVASDKSDEIYPFLATMMGLPLNGKQKERVKGIEGEALEKLILKNLRDLIISAAKDKPRIYLIEDMHWADSSSITMFESLYKLSQNHPVMFINVLRPGYKETGDYILKWLVDNLPGDNITINISPLADGESGELINNLLKKVALPEKVASTIIRKTEGNPFFIEEVIRSFLDEGIIEIKEKEFIVTDKINEVNIPETINDVILSRVDKLDEKTRELLNTASVIGRNFYYKVLEEATDTIEELDDRLAYLTEVQLISESKKKEEIEYLFKHALAQQATYESIVLNSKKELHLKIARSIEKVFAENLNEFYGTLAQHYEKAGKPDKTEEYLLKAGDEALRTGAHIAAINYFESALQLIPVNSADDRNLSYINDINEKLAYAYYAIGQTRKSAGLFIQSTNFHIGYRLPSNRIILILQTLKSFLGLYLKILFWNGKKKRVATDQDNRILKILIFQGEAIATHNPRETFFRTINLLNYFPLSTIVSSQYGLGSFLGTCVIFPWTGRGLKFGKRFMKFTMSIIDDQLPMVWLIGKYMLSMYDYFVGQLKEGTEDEKVFELSMELGLVWSPTVFHAFKGISYTEMGLKAKYKKLQTNLLTIANNLENTLTWVQYNRLKQTHLLKLRMLDEAIDGADDMISYNANTDHLGILLLIYNHTSMAYCFKGNLVMAKLYLSKAEEIVKNLWLKYYISITLLSNAYIQISEFEIHPDTVRKDKLKELLKTTKNLVIASAKVNCIKTEAYRLRAISFQLCNQIPKALKYYGKSIEFAKWYGAKLELSRTYFELGKFLSDPKSKLKQFNSLSGKEYLEKARAMFEEMDLQWDLEELEKFRNGSL